MAQDNCDPKNNWPARNDCDLKNIRPRRSAVATVFRAANAGIQTLFRRGVAVTEQLRPASHCIPRPEFVLTPVYTEKREYVYNESGVLVFCEVRVV